MKNFTAILILAWFVASSGGAELLRVESVGLKLTQQSEVPAQESGPIQQILVHEGQRVAAGALLARIDDRDALIEVERAKLNRDNAKELASSDAKHRSSQLLLKLAELDLQRAKDQLERFADTVSDAEQDRLEVSVQRARLEVELARQDRSTSRRNLLAAENALQVANRGVEKRKVIAPIEGIVVGINFRQGEWVKPGDKVIRLVDTSRLRAEGLVSANELSGDLTGCAATFVADDTNHEPQHYEGEVVFLSPEANPVSGEVRVWAEIENKDGRLRPGSTGQLIIRTTTSVVKRDPSDNSEPQKQP